MHKLKIVNPMLKKLAGGEPGFRGKVEEESSLRGLQHYFLNSNDAQSIVDGFDEGLREQLAAGLTGAARPLLLASLYKSTNRPQLVVTHNLFQAQKIYDDLAELVGEDEVYLYPVNELIASEIAVASPELKGQRIEALNYWAEHEKGIIIAPVAGLRRMLPPKSVWKYSQLDFTVGEEIDVEEYLAKLVNMGYERTGMVSAPGEFSMRGGIIDVYPLTEAMPLRIELFDTEIDSIRYFDVEDQRSQDKTETVRIGPATEVLLYNDEFERGASRLEEELSKSLKKVKDASVKEQMSEKVSSEIDQLKNGQTFEQIFKYMGLFYKKTESLLDYLPENGLVMMDEISRIHETSSTLDKEEADWHTSLLQIGKIVSDIPLSHHLGDLLQKTARPRLYLSLFLKHVPHTNPQNIINFMCRSMQNFHGQMHVLKGELDRWKHSGYRVVFLAADEKRVEKLQSVLDDYDIEAGVLDRDAEVPGAGQFIMEADLSSGFELPGIKLAVITEEELFKKKSKKPKRRQKLSNAERIKSYSELKVGDYVVHVNHGIGKYLGIETLEINGIHKDYLHVKYSGNDKLYVPVEQIDQVQKYVGSEGKEPKVYKLGGTEWKKVKSRVQSSVQDIADDLIKLYAERESTPGYPYSEDTEEQRQFESAFPYQETEDQLRTIQEIKEDMEKARPMDRLLCGDVGYGKTEVAIRAAFKAIMEGKQVAFLVPTTILAQQHFETISERFQDHAINIGMLSRFRTRKQQNETIKGLKAGTVDIVIGTHRLLSKDLKFRDLGLLIIDEEQRFGVTHKEKIKQMRANVDVLTLTATPIPRTLHMSMLGVRDLSVIETPPENRFPVQTYVVEYNGALVREAIERELGRGGQVYFLYNRVEDIERKAEEISMLVPDARVTFAHGKMNETELEAVMIDFLEGHYDVLVSTTIIETGVDIPNVNTLIVNNADKMGLSQLYQLRGRVGRSNRVAYAYFTYQRDKVLNEVAEKRLQSIKEFTELGSGFKIAMRDLSIRGAGNILGAEQHGFIDSVGFDLYSQMLQEAIEERKTGPSDKPAEKPIDVDMNLELDAYIPEEYIKDEQQKIDMYKRFRNADTVEDVEDLQEEMVDRFGDYPEEVGYLFYITKFRLLMRKERVELLARKKHEIELRISEEASDNIDGAKLFEMANDMGNHVRLGTEGKKLKVIISTRKMELKDQLSQIEHVLRQLDEVKREKVGS